MRTLRTLSLAEAQAIAAAALVAAKSRPTLAPVCIAVCDVTGLPLVVLTMDGCAPASVTIATNKGYTVIQSGGKPTALYAQLAAEGVFDPHNWTDPRMTAFGGGLPIHDSAGQLVGAIGVSGRKPEEDADVGEMAIANWEK